MLQQMQLHIPTISDDHLILIIRAMHKDLMLEREHHFLDIQDIKVHPLSAIQHL